MKTDIKNLCAVGCGLLYIIVFLFLPFLAIKVVGFGASGMDLIDLNVWMFVPLLAGIAMIVFSLIGDKKISVIVSVVSAFIPLFVYFIVHDALISDVLRLFGLSGVAGSITGSGIGYVLTVGIGVFLDMLLGLGCAVLCWLSGNTKATVRTAGMGATEDDEW